MSNLRYLLHQIGVGYFRSTLFFIQATNITNFLGIMLKREKVKLIVSLYLPSTLKILTFPIE